MTIQKLVRYCLVMTFSIYKKYNLGSHFLFWAAVWLFYIFFFSYNSTHTEYTLALSTYLIPITAIATYTMVYRFIPKFLTAKKYLQFGIYTFISLLLSTFFILIFLILSISFIPEFKTLDLPPMGKNYVFVVLLVYLVVSLVSFANIWRRNTKTAMVNNKLQKELVLAKFHAKQQELNYLKSQIHPHFLFNTLNTIYGLALQKSEDSPDVILKLSNLLDYILYQTNKPEVPLINEIKHIEDYIALEKIRFKDTLTVHFTKNITNKSASVAPMLLLPFIENAFKHGSIIEETLNVLITISITEKELYFSIKNTYNPNVSNEGLGLKNIKERLELSYPGDYELLIETSSQWYEVQLKLKL